jgi:hypothetical protein
MLDIVQGHASDAATQKRFMGVLERSLAAWPELTAHDIRNFVVSIVVRIQVHADRITIMQNPLRLVQWLGQLMTVLSSQTEMPRTAPTLRS